MKYKQKFKEHIIKKYGEQETLDDLANIVIAVINEQMGCTNKVIGFSWKVSYTDKISNSHNCPIDGVENFGNRNPDAPRSYPGFYGRVWIRTENSTYGIMRDAFGKTLTYPGTGGQGSYDGPWSLVSNYVYTKNGNKKNKDDPSMNMFSWDYKIWVDDWPEIKKAIEHQIFMDKMSGRSTKIGHTFLWNDEETAKKDAEFIKTWTKSNG